VFDHLAEEVFTGVMEQLRATELERGRARFEIEADHGQKIRVRLAVDNNLVTARIDAPSEHVRDLLAGHAWQLNQRLETEGLIPQDIEFGFAGGREEASSHGEGPDLHTAATDVLADENLDDLTMVEGEAHAFESWA
jgi:hypothetical protein